MKKGSSWRFSRKQAKPPKQKTLEDSWLSPAVAPSSAGTDETHPMDQPNPARSKSSKVEVKIKDVEHKKDHHQPDKQEPSVIPDEVGVDKAATLYQVAYKGKILGTGPSLSSDIEFGSNDNVRNSDLSAKDPLRQHEEATPKGGHEWVCIVEGYLLQMRRSRR
jgi:hypothetical protein